MDGDQEENWISSHAPRKRVVLSRNNQKWESLREDIRRIYMIENNTLSKAMEMIEEKYRFKAGPRKWKTKLKEWGYEKHLSKSQMKSIVAKVEKRLRDEGKDTVIFHNGVKMPVEKLENFKRRKTVRQSEPVSLVAETPSPISYFTPRPESHKSPNVVFQTISEESGSVKSGMTNVSENGNNITVPDPSRNFATPQRLTNIIERIPVEQAEIELVTQRINIIHFSRLVFKEPIKAQDKISRQIFQLCHWPIPHDLQLDARPVDPSLQTKILRAFHYQRVQRPVSAADALGFALISFLKEEAAMNFTSVSILTSTNLVNSHNAAIICARRMLVAKLGDIFGESAQCTKEAQELLADSLAKPEDAAEATCLYMSAMEGYERLDLSPRVEGQWRCVSAMANIFRLTDRHELAVNLIHIAFNDALSYAIESIEETSAQKGIYFTKIYMALYQSSICLTSQAATRTHWAGLASALPKLLQLTLTSLEWNLSIFPTILNQSIDLAGSYSKLGEFDDLERIFFLAISKYECQPLDILVDRWLPQLQGSRGPGHNEHPIMETEAYTKASAQCIMGLIDEVLEISPNIIAFANLRGEFIVRLGEIQREDQESRRTTKLPRIRMRSNEMPSEIEILGCHPEDGDEDMMLKA